MRLGRPPHRVGATPHPRSIYSSIQLIYRSIHAREHILVHYIQYYTKHTSLLCAFNNVDDRERFGRPFSARRVALSVGRSHTVLCAHKTDKGRPSCMRASANIRPTSARRQPIQCLCVLCSASDAQPATSAPAINASSSSSWCSAVSSRRTNRIRTLANTHTHSHAAVWRKVDHGCLPVSDACVRTGTLARNSYRFVYYGQIARARPRAHVVREIEFVRVFGCGCHDGGRTERTVSVMKCTANALK